MVIYGQPIYMFKKKKRTLCGRPIYVNKSSVIFGSMSYMFRFKVPDNKTSTWLHSIQYLNFVFCVDKKNAFTCHTFLAAKSLRARIECRFPPGYWCVLRREWGLLV